MRSPRGALAVAPALVFETVRSPTRPGSDGCEAGGPELRCGPALALLLSARDGAGVGVGSKAR
ncbi:MAG: hypothetical protein INH37_13255 [Myxococcaceae bacterium]|jgi:hypothetical protein|nr:hypothetical protein [Myxococcaceae bacterium]